MTKHFYLTVQNYTDDQIAIVDSEKKSITYCELNQRVNKLANYWYSLNLSAEATIGLFFNPSIEYIISMLAIMQAGYSFMALSHNTKTERLSKYIRYENLYGILSSEQFKNAAFIESYKGRKLLFEDEEAKASDCSDKFTIEPVKLSQLAYIHNTSGSTGEPKQVLVEHRGLYNCMQDAIDKLDIKRHDRVIAFSDIAFDAHIFDIMIALGAGARLYFLPQEIRLDYIKLKHYYNSNAITVSVLTPSILTDLNPSEFDHLRVLLSTGEKITPATIKKWSRDSLLFINGYGPAEATIATSMALVNAVDPINIGTPLRGLQIYLLEEKPENFMAPQLVKEGEKGEIYIAGEGLARGYTNKELTELRFREIVDPYDSSKKLRVYQTRDQGILLEAKSNKIQVIGRLDRQIKVYAKIICPEEIEAVLQQDGVNQAEIEVAFTERGHPCFTAYLRVNDKKSFCLQEFYHKVYEQFPANTAPAKWVVLDEKSLNLSGKSDLKKSGQPAWRLHSYSNKNPQLVDELTIEKIWKDALELSDESLHLDDNFFELGGTSKQAAYMLDQLKLHFKTKIELLDIYRLKTIGGIARFISRSKSEFKAELTIIKLNEKDNTNNNLKPLFLIHSLLGDPSNDYYQLVENWPVKNKRRIFAIKSRGLNNASDMDDDLETIAIDYIAAIKTIQSTGPYFIGGWSAGGIIALAIAKKLQERSEEVVTVVIDSEAPSTYHAQSRKLYAQNLRNLYKDKLARMLGNMVCDFDRYSFDIMPKHKQINRFFDVIEQSLKESIEEKTETNDALYKQRQNLIANIRNIFLAILNNRLVLKPENALLIVAEETQKKWNDPVIGWPDGYFKAENIIAEIGNHESIVLNPHSAKRVASAIEAFCLKSEKKNIETINHPQDLYNSSFYVNRDEDEQKITHLMSGESKDSSPIVVRLYGPVRGIGKTSLALNYFFQNKSRFKQRYWFNFKKLHDEYKAFGQSLNLVGESVSYDELIKTVNNWFKSQSDWLIVYDDVPEFKDILLPTGNGHILMTSTSSNRWTALGDSQIEVFTMKKEQACKLIKRITGKDKDTELLARELGYLPIALLQAGAYLNMHKHKTIPEYIQSLKKHAPEVFKNNYLATEHSKSIYASLTLNLEEINHPLVPKLITYLSCLNNVNIPFKLIQFLSGGSANELDTVIQYFYKYAIVSCVENVNTGGMFITIHSLVQDVHYKDDYLFECIRTFRNAFVTEIFDNTLITDFELMPHFMKFIELLGEIQLDAWLVNYGSDIINLHITVISYYIEVYQLDAAEKTLKIAQAIFEKYLKFLGDDTDILEVNLLYCLTRIYLLRGLHQKAYGASQQMIAAINNNVITDKLKYFLVYSECLRAMGKNEEAVKICKSIPNYQTLYEICHRLADIYYDISDDCYYDYYELAIRNLDEVLANESLAQSQKAKLYLDKAKIYIKLGERSFGFKLSSDQIGIKARYIKAISYLNQSLELYRKGTQIDSIASKIIEGLILTHRIELEHQFVITEVEKIDKQNFVRKLPEALYALYALLTDNYKRLNHALVLLEKCYSKSPNLLSAKVAYITILNHYAVGFYSLAEKSHFPYLKQKMLRKAANYYQKINDIVGFDPTAATHELQTLSGPPIDNVYILRHLDNTAIYNIIKGEYKKAINCYQKGLLICIALPSLHNRALRSLSGIVLCCVRSGYVSDRLRAIWQKIKPSVIGQNLNAIYKTYFDEIDNFLIPASSKYSLAPDKYLLSILFLCVGLHFKQESELQYIALVILLVLVANQYSWRFKSHFFTNPANGNNEQLDLLDEGVYILIDNFLNEVGMTLSIPIANDQTSNNRMLAHSN